MLKNKNFSIQDASGKKLSSITVSGDISEIKKKIQNASEIPIKKAVPFLMALSVHPNTQVRRAVATELGEFKYLNAIEIFLSLLVDRRAEVRRAATIALSHIESPAILPLIESMSHDQSKQVRRAVSKVLLDLKETASTDTLAIGTRLVQDDDVETAGRALLAINKLKPSRWIGGLADKVVKGAKKHHPNLYAMHQKSEAEPSRYWESMKRKTMEKKMGTPKPQFDEIAKDVNSSAQDKRPRHLYGLWSAMLKDDSFKEGYIDFISCDPGYEYQFSVVISPEAISGADKLAELPTKIGRTTLAVALVPDNEYLEIVDDDSPVKPLYILAKGSSSAAHFKLRGLKQGQSRLQVLVYHKGYLVMRGYTSSIQIKARPGKVEPFEEGQPTVSTVTGILMDHGEDLATIAKNMKKERFASLLIDRDKTNDKLLFALFCQNGGNYKFTTAWIPAESAQIAFDSIREELRSLINMKKDLFQHVFLRDHIDLKIKLKYAKRALSELRKTGITLFSCLFRDPSIEPVRKQLIDLASQNRKDGILQIVSDVLFVPWQLMYLDDKKAEPNVSLFWGMRFQIEHILAEGVGLKSWKMGKSKEPMISFINKFLPADTVKVHDSLFQIKKWTEEDVLNDFKRKTNQRPAFYFYCHAKFDSENPDKCWIKLTDDRSKLTLLDLQRETSFDQVGNQLDFSNAPLVFLNACQSGQVEGSFYRSFVGFLLRDKKAGGVIGTETIMPAYFATDFAKQFWNYINHRAMSVGQVLLELRKHYWQKYNNPLAMLYSLYMNAEKVVALR